MTFLPLFPTEPTDEDFGDYLAGVAGTDTRQHVETWLEVAESHRVYLEHLMNAWDAGRRPPIEGDVDRFLRTFHQARAQNHEPRETESLVQYRSQDTALSMPGWSSVPGKRRFTALTYLAAFTILCLVGGSVVSLRKTWDSGGEHQTYAVRTYTTTNAQRTSIQLPDGSSVILGPASRLDVDARFANGERRVMVTGEALFTTQHQANQPFIVHSARTVTQVLGTVFAVRKYPEDTAVRVVVTKGRVATGTVDASYEQNRGENQVDTASHIQRRSTIVNAGQVAYVLPGNQTTVAYAASTKSLLGWSEGLLTVQDTPIRELLSEFRRFYDIVVTTDDPEILSRRVTATFVSMPASEALGVLQEMLDVRAVRQGNAVVLYQSSRNTHREKN